MLTVLILLASLLLSPRARYSLFPPAPLALVDHKTGGLCKPPAGVLGSTDSATGAPENARGEAVENEASNFATAVAAIAINIFTDSDPQHDKLQDAYEESDILPKPNELATKIATMKDKASGVNKPSHDKTKSPMEKIMWSKMKPLVHEISFVSDTWERCTK